MPNFEAMWSFLTYFLINHGDGDQQHERLRQPIAAFIIAVIPVVLSGLLAIFGTEIRGASRRFVFGIHSGRVSWITVFFYGVLLVWVRLLYLRLVVEHREKKDTREHLQSALFHGLNEQLFEASPRAYRRSANLIYELLDDDYDGPAAEAGAIAAAVRTVLKSCAEITALFTDATGGKRYSANVMLLATPEADGIGHLYPQPLLEELRFFDHQLHNIDTLSGLLYMPGELAFVQAENHPAEEDFLLCIPVPEQLYSSSGLRWALPGAPTALLTDGHDVIPDTRDLEKESYAIGKELFKEVRDYFRPGGLGASVRSFVSLRLGEEEENPVGVLNVDCDRPQVLGGTEYPETYFAIMSPFLALLEHAVVRYSQLRRDDFGVVAPGPDEEADAIDEAVGPGLDDAAGTEDEEVIFPRIEHNDGRDEPELPNGVQDSPG
jgi:hypothetical protein